MALLVSRLISDCFSENTKLSQGSAVEALSVQKQRLDFVSSYIDSISEVLRPVSLRIHDNPELNFKEFIAHETLTKFLNSRKGWKVTPSAYKIETAFIAEYDGGRKGPVISYNIEYGE